MNFSGFQLWRNQNLLSHPRLLDCGETNLYRSLASLQPKPAASVPDGPVYRCDLARAWLSRYSFPEKHSRQALICRGVRHALALIFKCLAADHAQLWIPADVYPVYLELAQATGLVPHTFNTLPHPEIPTAPPAGARTALSASSPPQSAGYPEYLLLANPWKPLGRFLTAQETTDLIRWLADSPHRKLLIDCVYDFGQPFHATTQQLFQTGRAILLHSATKGWLWPKTFGVALLPEKQDDFEAAFRADSPAPEQLQLARQFLSVDAGCPQEVAAALRLRANALLDSLPTAVRHAFPSDPATSAASCYFFPVNLPAEELLQRHRILAIPATTFGATWHGSILTSLAPVFSASQKGARP